MTKLQLVGLSKGFGGVQAVRNLELTVAGGSLVALLGASGCGKTTTLRLIAGLEQPDSGDILFGGVSVLNLPPEARGIGMVFQRYVLFPHMTVAQNVGFGLRMRGMKRPEVAARVAEVLKVVQLEGYASRYPRQLSGGQQQRVALARTVVTEPRILLMDEPLSNLDAQLRDEMRGFIRELQRRLGITTLFVTHDQSEAITLADGVGVMFDGRLEGFGTPEEVYARPSTLRLAEFMGATNVLYGKLVAKDAEGSLLETPLGTFRVAQQPPQETGERVVATVRPEHVVLEPLESPPSQNAFLACITEAVYHGGTVQYRLEAQGLPIRVTESSLRRYSVGERVRLRLPHAHVWILPQSIG